jgi:hypothetical protein
MKMQDVEVGGRYAAKVSGKATVVRVVEIEESTIGRKSRTRIHAVNEATGRRITLRSAQRLRKRVAGEYSRQMRRENPDNPQD